MQGRYKAMVVDADAKGYFSAAAAYIHLNPARIGRRNQCANELAAYRWSSFPMYVRPSKRPHWLMVDRVFGDLGVQDNQAGRAWFNEYMISRINAISSASDPANADDAWEVIRKGWYLGSDEFRDQLLLHLDKSLQKAKRHCLRGEEMKRHDEAEAEKLLQSGLIRLGLAESDLADLSKGADEKAVLAWHIRKRTMVSRTWVTQRLGMGDESHVTKLAGAVERQARYGVLKAKVQSS
jgi:hypothetical protein